MRGIQALREGLCKGRKLLSLHVLHAVQNPEVFKGASLTFRLMLRDAEPRRPAGRLSICGPARSSDGVNRRDVGINHPDAVANAVANVVANVAVKLSKTEECAVKALLRTPHLTASSLAAILEVSPRQAQRIIASLKKKVGLKRRGADKNGEWYFEADEDQ